MRQCYEQVYYPQYWTKYLEDRKGIGGRNLDRNRKFYIYFCEVFDYFCQQFSSRRNTGHCAISPYKTENFLVRPNLLRH